MMQVVPKCKKDGCNVSLIGSHFVLTILHCIVSCSLYCLYHTVLYPLYSWFVVNRIS